MEYNNMENITSLQVKNALERAKVDKSYGAELQKRLETGKYDSQLSELGIVRSPQGLKRISSETQQTTQEPSQVGYSNTGQELAQTGKDIVGTVKETGQKIADAQRMSMSGEQSPIESGFQMAGAVASGISGVAGDVLKGAAQVVLPQEAETALKAGMATGVQKAGDVLSKYENLKQTKPALAGAINLVLGSTPEATLGVIDLVKGYEKLKTTNPRLARNLDSALGIGELAIDVATLGGAKAGTTVLKEGAKEVAEVAGKQAAKVAGDVATGVGKAGARVGKSVSSISPVVESVGSTIGGALRRGKEAVVEGVQEAQRVSKLPVAEKQAVRSGLDTGVIDFVKTTSKENIPVYQEIVGAAKAGADNLRGGTKAKEVVGKMIIDKAVAPAIKLKNTVGKKLGDVVDILPKVPENVTPLRDEFAKVLDSVGVRVGNKGKLVSTRGGVKGDLTAYQNMWDRIKSGYASQKEIHDIRSAVFKEFDLAKARQTPFSSQADNVAEQFRSILGKGISNKQYLELSKQYSETIRPLQEFVKYIGYKGDIEKLGTQNLRVAEIAQRVLGNASARPQEVIDAITTLADKAGKGKLSKDISDAIRFSDLIEDFYGLQQTRSLAGQVAKGTKAGVEGATESVIQGAANGGVTGMVGSVVKGVLGKTTAEQQKALDALLSSLSKTK